ncbi:hypothetical protein ACRQ5Q_21765 [Bradyrhizobium sp. PMVTL-01]
MKRLVFGLAALCGTLLLALVWLGQHEREAAIERLERYEFSPR